MIKYKKVGVGSYCLWLHLNFASVNFYQYKNFILPRGQRDMILLCLADDIEVIFYETEMETGKKTWEDRGVFSPTDVHRQVILK